MVVLNEQVCGLRGPCSWKQGFVAEKSWLRILLVQIWRFVSFRRLFKFRSHPVSKSFDIDSCNTLLSYPVFLVFNIDHHILIVSKSQVELAVNLLYDSVGELLDCGALNHGYDIVFSQCL